MEIYLVGGAVRDQLLNLPVKEKDYVVVGGTVDTMLKLGYKQVGKDFPVFLHPQTKEEYALARMERKTGKGYTGFAFDTSANVTLEEDLLRRDLTINAIAQRLDTGSLIDPFHGADDIRHKILRHVSPAFAEDPVRVLRTARFAARFAYLGFQVAEETIDLMEAMVNSGEINALVPERVWKELERGLQEKNPEVFFEILQACKALPILFPELKPDNIINLAKVARISSDAEIRFAALLLNLSLVDIEAICTRFRIPAIFKELALLSAKHYEDYQASSNGDAEQLLNLLYAVDAFRRELRFTKFIHLCEAVNMVPNASLRLSEALAAAKKISIKDIANKNLQGDAIAKAIFQERIKIIKQMIETANARSR